MKTFLREGIRAHSALTGLGIMLLFLQAVMADTAVNVSDIKGCRVIEANAERLLCYDTVADGGIFNQQQLEQVQRENFGSKETKPEISVDRLSVTIVRMQKDAAGLRYFYTSDGQVWKQKDRGGWSSEIPFEAELKSGLMGSFFMVSESGRSIRVKRVR